MNVNISDMYGHLKASIVSMLATWKGWLLLFITQFLSIGHVKIGLIGLLVVYTLDFITGTLASFHEKRALGQKVTIWDFESAKIRKSLAKAVTYICLIVGFYVLYLFFFDKSFSLPVSTRKLNVVEVTIGVCMAIEIWSNLENARRCGFDLFEKIHLIIRKIWQLISEVKGKAVVLLLVLMLQACSPAKIAMKYLDKHPTEFAGLCAEKYPVKDSIAPPVIKYLKADNIDYTRSIDSLQNLVENLNSQAVVDSAMSLPGTEANTRITGLLAQIADLKASISVLKRSYKPCKPDTVSITQPIYLENTAKTAALIAENNKTATTLRAWKKAFWVIVVMFLAILIPFVIILKRKE